MTWTIRLASEEDIATMREVERDAGRRFYDVGIDEIAEDEPPSTACLTAHIETATVWVACDQDAIIGYVIASVVDGEGHVDQVSVRQSDSGRGVGRSLIERVHEWAQQRGFGSVTLTTFKDVAWNAPYYERLGYVIVDSDAQGTELMAISSAETESRLDAPPRVAMRRSLRI